jgi:hypothetical protein
MKQNEMGRACGIFRGEEKCIVLVEKPEGKIPL